MNQAVQHNLPIFSKCQTVPFNGRYYINAKVGFEVYMGFMSSSPRKDYFAFIESYGEREGQFKIGRLDLSDVTKRIKKDSIFIEVVPNKCDNFIDYTEFIPRMSSGYLSFITNEVQMPFFDWMRFLKNKIYEKN